MVIETETAEGARTGVRVGHGQGRARRQAWIQPPRLRTIGHEDEEERHATWLELFFDLVFVVAIAQLAHELVVDHSLAGFLRFGGLFVPVYVAWQGYSIYADRFDSDDLIFRGAYFVAMLAIAALAILIPDIWHGHHSAGFAIAYVVLRAIMIGLYVRAYRVAPLAQPLIRRYAGGYSFTVLLWLASLAFSEPTRYVIWGVALAIDLALPPISIPLHRQVPTSASHIPERWGLFTLIALGESVVAVALGASETEFEFISGLCAVLGFVVVALLWWLYFDGHEGIRLKPTPAPMIYSYAHLPLLIGLAAVSAGISLLIEEATHDHLPTGATGALAGGTALYLFALLVVRAVSRRGDLHAGALHKAIGIALCIVLIVIGQWLPPVLTVVLLLVVVGWLAMTSSIYLRSSVVQARTHEQI